MKLTEKQKDCFYCHFEQGELGLELTTHDGNKANLFKNPDGYYLGVWNTHHHKLNQTVDLEKASAVGFRLLTLLLFSGTPNIKVLVW